MNLNKQKDIAQHDVLSKAFYEMVFKEYFDIENECSSEFTDVENDKKNVLSGVNVITKMQGFSWNTAIKAQTNGYIGFPFSKTLKENSPTPTFAAELAFKGRKGYEYGWLLDDSRVDHYLFAWIHSAIQVERMKKDASGNFHIEEDTRINSRQQLQKVEFMLVSRDEIKNFVYRKLEVDSRPSLFTYAKNVAASASGIDTSHGIKLITSRGFPEAPVNIIIGKKDYKNMLGTFHFLWTVQDGMKELGENEFVEISK